VIKTETKISDYDLVYDFLYEMNTDSLVDIIMDLMSANRLKSLAKEIKENRKEV
jgi:hypothetical protein